MANLIDRLLTVARKVDYPRLLTEDRRVDYSRPIAPSTGAQQASAMGTRRSIAIFSLKEDDTDLDSACSILYSIAMGRMLDNGLDDHERFGAYLSFLTLASRSQIVTLIACLDKLGYRVVNVVVGSDPTVISDIDDNLSRDLLRSADKIDITWNFKVIGSIAGLLCMFIGKQPTEAGYDKWWSNNVKNFVGRFAGAVSETTLNRCKLKREAAQFIYQKVSSSLPLRRFLFYSIRSYADGHDGAISDGFKVGIQSLRGTGMTHIALIDKYLVSPTHLGVLLLKLRPEMCALTAIYRRLGSMTAEQVQFTKITGADEENEVFNRTNVAFFTAAALYIGIKSQSTLKFYDQRALDLLDAKDKSYLDAVDDLMKKSVGVDSAIPKKEYGESVISQVINMMPADEKHDPLVQI